MTEDEGYVASLEARVAELEAERDTPSVSALANVTYFDAWVAEKLLGRLTRGVVHASRQENH